jgi:sugar phosphate isomerase/epimerase
MIIYGNDYSKDTVAFLQKHGYGIELTRYSVPHVLDNLPGVYPETSDMLQGFTMFSMHGAYLDVFYVSKDPLICEVAKKRTMQSLQAARYHSINHVVFHTSYRKFFDGYSKNACDDFIKKATAFWLHLKEYIPDEMTIYLENVEEENPEILFNLIDSIGSPKIRCCLDVGHAHCNSGIPLKNWIDVLGRHIGYVHMHDNTGNNDQHLPLGEGNIPLVETINDILAYSTDIPFVLECDVVKSLGYLRKLDILPAIDS